MIEICLIPEFVYTVTFILGGGAIELKHISKPKW